MTADTLDLMFELDPGNLPSWVSALAACFAALIASVALTFTRRSARSSEIQRDVALDQIEYRNAKDREEQASKVAVWVSASRDPEDGFPLVKLHYVNKSGLPVWNLMVILEACTTRRVRLLVAEPTDKVQVLPFDAATGWARTVIDGKLATLSDDLPSTYRDGTFSIESDALCQSLQETGVSVIFLDANKQTWRRDASGFLHEIEIDYDKTWMTTTLRQDKVRNLSKAEEENHIHIDFVSSGAKNRDRTEARPNPNKFPNGSLTLSRSNR
ncbi:hypothetical protein [Saccharopolyspora sp. SCSIO 74807]|uniref:hypothetical protein n=1 Tax=Saccharopolyspora sp. SCSIO 74807 TaxID=3118084 RepID=UPI0030CB1386